MGKKNSLLIYIFNLGFLSLPFTFHRTLQSCTACADCVVLQRGRRRSFQAPLYHFHRLHRHLDISRAIVARSSPLHIASEHSRTSMTVNIYSLKKLLPSTYLQENVHSPVMVFQEIFTPWSRFFLANKYSFVCNSKVVNEYWITVK